MIFSPNAVSVAYKMSLSRRDLAKEPVSRCSAPGGRRLASAQRPSRLKIFISVDMEGITGIANWDDVTPAARITACSGRS
jgi:hypothetical protein